jgi:hypothetical protein
MDLLNREELLSNTAFDGLDFDGVDLDGLRLLRATTMVRLAGDRLHRGYVDGTLDEKQQVGVDRAVAELGRLEPPVAAEYAGNLVLIGVEHLADALDADDHVAGQLELDFGSSMMAAMAIRSGWAIGTLNPF